MVHGMELRKCSSQNNKQNDFIETKKKKINTCLTNLKHSYHLLMNKQYEVICK